MVDYIIAWFIRRVIVGISMMVIAMIMMAVGVSHRASRDAADHIDRTVSTGGPNGLQDSWNEGANPSSYRASDDYARTSDDYSRHPTSYGSSRYRPGEPMASTRPSR